MQKDRKVQKSTLMKVFGYIKGYMPFLILSIIFAALSVEIGRAHV